MKPIVKSLAPAPLLLGVWLLGGSSCLGQDPTVGVPIHTWERQFGLGRLQGAVASPDGTYLATFGARGGFLRFATNGALVRNLPGLTDWIEGRMLTVNTTGSKHVF